MTSPEMYQQQVQVQERRQSIRIPVLIDLIALIEDQATDLHIRTSIIDVSRNGIAIEGGFCENCSGYLPGTVHPACILAPYNELLEGAHELTITIFPPGNKLPLSFKGRVVYTHCSNGHEKIGIMFSESGDRDELLKLAEDGLTN